MSKIMTPEQLFNLNKISKAKTVCVSGGFDPLTVAHLRMFKIAAQYGNLVVIINNDNWLIDKKKYNFHTQEDRCELISSYSFVQAVCLTGHKSGDDSSICKELEIIRPDIFCNGGDRKEGNIPEYELCEKLGIEMKFGIGGSDKIRSSSELVRNALLNF